jgi:hypothetical protein
MRATIKTAVDDVNRRSRLTLSMCDGTRWFAVEMYNFTIQPGSRSARIVTPAKST